MCGRRPRTWCRPRTAVGPSPSGCSSTSAAGSRDDGREGPAASKRTRSQASAVGSDLPGHGRFKRSPISAETSRAAWPIRGHLRDQHRPARDGRALLRPHHEAQRRGGPGGAQDPGHAVSMSKFYASEANKRRAGADGLRHGDPGAGLGGRGLQSRPSSTRRGAGCAPRATPSRVAPRRSS